MIKTKQGPILLKITIICLFFLAGSCQYFTPLEMHLMLQDIDNYFFKPNPQFNMEIRKFLRAAFHDCMGGCDGSIDILKTDNRGLEPFVQVVTTAYNTAIKSSNPRAYLFNKMKRSDFWVLCESRALGWGIKNSGATVNYKGVTFVAGRYAAPSPNNSPNEATLPNAAGSWTAMLNNLKTGIPTLSQKDIVALLGLHGAGTAESVNSGFRGPWLSAPNKNKVNNQFFVGLLGLGFPQQKMTQIKASDTNFPNNPNNGAHPSPNPPENLIQWVKAQGPGASSVQMMMPIDMQMYLQFTPNATGGQSSGEYCPQGNLSKLVECTTKNTPSTKYLSLAKNAPTAFQYAKDNALYLADLIPAWLRMVSYKGSDSKMTSAVLTPFIPAWGCVNGVATCLGDIFFSNCQSLARITC